MPTKASHYFKLNLKLGGKVLGYFSTNINFVRISRTRASMGNMLETVDSLEKKIYELININKKLNQLQESTEAELAGLRSQNERLQAELKQQEKNNHSLKAANAILGSKDYKRETKLQINSLIREIDQCIVQLSE